MTERGGGSVVLIGAQAMYRPQVPQIAYAAAKGALNSSMYYMATDLGPSRIRVNTVVPTWMWGPPVEGYVSWQAQERGVPAEEIIGDITANMPLGEIPADEDVAEAVGFLLSSARAHDHGAVALRERRRADALIRRVARDSLCRGPEHVWLEQQ